MPFSLQPPNNLSINNINNSQTVMGDYPIVTQPPPINASQSQLSGLDMSELMVTPTQPPPPYPAISSSDRHPHHNDSFDPNQPLPPHNDSMSPSDVNYSNSGGWCDLVCNPFLCCDSSTVPSMYSWCCCIDDETLSAAPGEGLYDDHMGGVGCCDGLEDCCAADGADCDMDCVIS